MISERAIPASSVRVAWFAWFLCALSVASASFGLLFMFLDGAFAHFFEESVGVDAAVAVAFPVVGAVVASHRPKNAVGWLFCAIGLSQGAAVFFGEYAAYALVGETGVLPAGVVSFWLGSWVWLPGVVLTLTFLLLLFPDGRLLSRRWRPVAWLSAAVTALGVLVLAVMPWNLLEPGLPAGNPLDLEVISGDSLNAIAISIYALGAACALLSVLSMILRFRRSRGEERQQLKWFVYAGVLYLFTVILPPSPLSDLQILTAPLLPVAAGIAILKHRLFDIDLIINRTLVYGALTACVVGIYILIVGYLGVLLRTDGNLAISLVATGAVAVLFAPMRDRLQRFVNRLTYGERDEPYAVLSRLGRRLEGTPRPEAVLPAVVEDVARALRLPHAAVWLSDGDALRLGASYGDVPPETVVRDPGAVEKLRHAPDGLWPENLDPSGEYGAVLEACGVGLVLPLTHRGEFVGALTLAPRGPGEGFTPADHRLLRDLAIQGGAAAHAVRLTATLRSSLQDLRRSREKLVAAQEEERRRIQRDLHDGLGPVLASMRLRLEACLDTAQATGSHLSGDLERLYELVGQATGDIRRLVYDLRPPVLDQLGLVAALRQHCDRFHRETGIEVGFEAEEGLPIPAAAEVTLLRVVQEALLNIQKHARASRADVRLGRRDGWLALEVRDDGVGFEADGRDGTGIGSMRERAELLGGTLELMSYPGSGTQVALRIPIEEAVP